VFVTSSLEAIAAIASIDGEPLPAPIPGPITREVRAAYVSAAIETGIPVPGWAPRQVA